MMRSSTSLLAIAALLLTSCGGGSGGSGSTVTLPTGGTPTPTPTTAGCSLSERQTFAFNTLKEWYLFPETLPASLSGSGYTTVSDYIDALTATARAQGRDRYFTYLTSIAQEDAFFSSGSSAGFGIRLSTDTPARRAYVVEAFEGAPALAAGIDRGDEILAIGTTTADLRAVSDIIASEGSAGVTNALGPSTAGTTRVLRVTNAASGSRTVTVTKANYDLPPVSSRYGSRILTVGGKQIGYINLRTFISSADAQLRTAFNSFRAAGVTEFIIDFRYNGGGLVATAELMGDLMGASRSGQVFSRTTFRPEKSSNNTTHNFAPGAQSVAPTKIAFIGTGATASASELVINSMAAYLGANVALVGANTYGKPVGQIAVDKTACDDRIRVVAFATASANGTNDYYTGLASKIANTCAAPDDFSHPLGDVQEASIAQAVSFLAGGSCSPIASAEQRPASARTGAPEIAPELLIPDQPTVSQREIPGSF